jgi:hypothetical protein
MMPIASSRKTDKKNLNSGFVNQGICCSNFHSVYSLIFMKGIPIEKEYTTRKEINLTDRNP